MQFQNDFKLVYFTNFSHKNLQMTVSYFENGMVKLWE